MDFTFDTWKRAATERLQTLGDRLERLKTREGPYLLYGTLCGLSLWPLVEAAQSGQLLPVIMALGGVAGGVGGNLIAEQIQRWQDQGAGVNEETVAAWVVEGAAGNTDLRQALDSILERLEAVQNAEAALAVDDRQWFAGTLRAEMAQLGNLPRFEATLIGSGTIAQDHSVAAGAGGVAVGRDVGGDVVMPGAHQEKHYHPAPTSEQQRQQEKEDLDRYLRNLQRLCNALPLAAMAEDETVHRRAEVTLNRVYISLNTTARVPLTQDGQDRHSRERPGFGDKERPLTALEATAREARLVILGDPGSGKSTFVNHLAYLLAGARLGQGETPDGWPHGPLLPIRILLRELAAVLPGDQDLQGLPAEKRAVRLVDEIWSHLRQETASTYRAAGVHRILEREVDRCQALVIFDGLDEVAPERRGMVRDAVDAFGQLCGENRVLVTCRVRSYSKGVSLGSFASVTLAPFEGDQIEEFVTRWYQALADLGTIKSQEAEKRAKNLHEAVQPMQELARNPLLLTTMAVVHTAQVELPRERARLYQRCVDVLLRRWHKHKVGEAPLLDRLGVSEAELLAALREVAYEAHHRGGTEEEGDLPRSLVLKIMAGHLSGHYGRAEQFLEYVDARAGLLIGRGGAEEPVYSFPHRTFQEYLAGCHLALGGRDFGRRLRRLLAEGDRWALASQLGAEHLLYNVGDVTRVLDASYTLCPVAEPDLEEAWRGVAWAGQFATEVGQRRVEQDEDAPDGGAAFLRRLVPRLVTILAQEKLGPVERAAAGRALGVLGDPRPGFGVDPESGLPDLAWCAVPAGPFPMGSDDEDELAFDNEKPQHEAVIAYDYRIAQYPLTNLQYAAFVSAQGYQERGYWTGAGWKWKGDKTDPRTFGGSFDLPNHPVVGLSWYEAVAFCRWLTEKLRETGGITQNDEIRLPTEAEWEKAARGTGGQTYPWGDEFDPARCNMYDTGIGNTSAVGAFPGSASPYGLLDTSGNVWEWCGTKWCESYEEEPDESLEGDALRVVRGGSFSSFQRYVRCAFRNWDFPFYWLNIVGFRVVVAPVTSGL